MPEKSWGTSSNWFHILFLTWFCVACKNPFQNWFLQAKNPVCWNWFLQLDFSKLNYRSTMGSIVCVQTYILCLCNHNGGHHGVGELLCGLLWIYSQEHQITLLFDGVLQTWHFQIFFSVKKDNKSLVDKKVLHGNCKNEIICYFDDPIISKVFLHH